MISKNQSDVDLDSKSRYILETTYYCIEIYVCYILYQLDDLKNVICIRLISVKGVNISLGALFPYTSTRERNAIL
jgi:hypothetical protein